VDSSPLQRLRGGGAIVANMIPSTATVAAESMLLGGSSRALFKARIGGVMCGEEHRG
jgi:hypothetical protein